VFFAGLTKTLRSDTPMQVHPMRFPHRFDTLSVPLRVRSAERILVEALADADVDGAGEVVWMVRPGSRRWLK
jgi:hypothetical protein